MRKENLHCGEKTQLLGWGVGMLRNNSAIVGGVEKEEVGNGRVGVLGRVEKNMGWVLGRAWTVVESEEVGEGRGE